MTTSEELYSALLSEALRAYVAQTSDMESAKQMAHHLAKSCVDECVRLGWISFSSSLSAATPDPFRYEAPIAEPYAGYATSEGRPPVGTPGIPTFAEMIPSHASGHISAGPGPILPPGSPFQPVQHYNTSSTHAPQPALPHAIATQAAAPWHEAPKKAVNGGVVGAQGFEPGRPWCPPHLAHLYRSVPLPAGAAPSGPHDVEGEGVISTPSAPRMMSNQTFVPPEGTGANKR